MVSQSDGSSQVSRDVPRKLQVPIDEAFQQDYATFADLAAQEGLTHSETVKALITQFCTDPHLRHEVVVASRRQSAARRQAANRARSASARQRHQAEE